MMNTASGANRRINNEENNIFSTGNIIFRDSEHEDFYYTNLSRCWYQDVYHQALIYCLGIDRDTREHADRIYDFTKDMVKIKCLKEGWQTGGSVRVVRLAFNLYCNGEPSLSLFRNRQEMMQESRLYDVDEIFCCGYAPFFMQAVQIRYPEYFAKEGAIGFA